MKFMTFCRLSLIMKEVTLMVKKVIGCLREYRTATIATLILTALETLLEIIVPFLQASIIDKGIYAGDRNALISTA